MQATIFGSNGLDVSDPARVETRRSGSGRSFMARPVALVRLFPSGLGARSGVSDPPIGSIVYQR